MVTVEMSGWKVFSEGCVCVWGCAYLFVWLFLRNKDNNKTNITKKKKKMDKVSNCFEHENAKSFSFPPKKFHHKKIVNWIIFTLMNSWFLVKWAANELGLWQQSALHEFDFTWQVQGYVFTQPLRASLGVVAIEKGAFRSPVTTIANFTYFIYIYLGNWK